MNILVINGAHREEGTTVQLALAFMEGARAAGAKTEMIKLRDAPIAHCTNCLKCYADLQSGPAPCSIHDAMDTIVPRLAAADGILFASPLHNGFISGLMTVFWERMTWRVLRPEGPILGIMCMRSRLTDKVRALGAIISAGGMPEHYRRFCNEGIPWMKSNAPLMLHGQWVGDYYAGAELIRRPQSKQDWARVYFLRRLSEPQIERARGLGTAMVQAIRSGRLKPVTVERMMPRGLRWLVETYDRIRPAYRVVKPKNTAKDKHHGST